MQGDRARRLIFHDDNDLRRSRWLFGLLRSPRCFRLCGLCWLCRFLRFFRLFRLGRYQRHLRFELYSDLWFGGGVDF